MLLVHAGNRVDPPGRTPPRFPVAAVAAVRERVARLLADLQPTAVVSAAAAGADLIVLEEAIRLGIVIHVALPLDVDGFRDRSVADLGGDWVERYDRVVDWANTHSSVHVENNGHRSDWFTIGNTTILDRAAEIAGDESIYALVIRPHGGEAQPSTTDLFADDAAARGWPVIELPLTS